MMGFKLANPDSLVEQVVRLADAKSEAWRTGFYQCLAAFNMTAGQNLARTYGLPEPVVANNNQRKRITQAESYLFQGVTEELAGYVAGWLLCAPEDYKQVLWGEGSEGLQASGQLRQAMYRFLNEGRLA